MLHARHTEDLDLYSVNFLHYGAPKQWYCIPPDSRQRFEGLIKGMLPDLFKACPEFFRHKVGGAGRGGLGQGALGQLRRRVVCGFAYACSPNGDSGRGLHSGRSPYLPMHTSPPVPFPPAPSPQELIISPALLDQFGIPYVKVLQNPREFVINYPGGWVGGGSWDVTGCMCGNVCCRLQRRQDVCVRARGYCWAHPGARVALLRVGGRACVCACLPACGRPCLRLCLACACKKGRKEGRLRHVASIGLPPLCSASH